MTLGERIRELRTVLGLSRAELAKDVGVSASYLVYIENGRRIPGPHTLSRLADRLGASRGEFLVLAGHVPEQAPQIQSAELEELLTIWRRLTADRQERILNFARFELAEIEKERKV